MHPREHTAHWSMEVGAIHCDGELALVPIDSSLLAFAGGGATHSDEELALGATDVCLAACAGGCNHGHSESAWGPEKSYLPGDGWAHHMW